MTDMWSFIRGTDSSPRQVKTTGDIDGGMASAATTLSATYQTPFEMHGSIGPSCAVADVQGDKATIWSGTQDSHGLQADLAKLLDIPAANIHVMNVEASGCYGHNGADLVTFDAALMSQLTGKPVRVQFMRNDEHAWEPKGPAMVQDFSGGVDADGNVVAYSHAGVDPATLRRRRADWRACRQGHRLPASWKPPQLGYRSHLLLPECLDH